MDAQRAPTNGRGAHTRRTHAACGRMQMFLQLLYGSKRKRALPVRVWLSSKLPGVWRELATVYVRVNKYYCVLLVVHISAH